MVRQICKTLVLLAAAITVYACAKSEKEDTREIYQRALDAWVSKHANIDGLQRLESGLYMKLISADSAGAKSPGNYTNPWIRMTYTGRTLDSTVFVNYYPELAKDLGTFNPATHYVPSYVLYYPGINLTQGQFEAISHMKEGDSAIVIVPVHLGFGSMTYTGSYGFAGTGTLGSNRPFMMNIKLDQVVPDPLEYEREEMYRYGLNYNYGFAIGATIKPEFAYKKIISTQQADSSILGVDSTVVIKYVGRFTDNFVLDTNIESYARALDIYDSDKSYSPLSYKPSGGGMIQAFYKALTDSDIKLRYGEMIDILFVSDYGYGSAGSTGGPTIVEPYTPLRFRFQVQRNINCTFDDEKLIELTIPNLPEER